jgi:hypothetical protein
VKYGHHDLKQAPYTRKCRGVKKRRGIKDSTIAYANDFIKLETINSTWACSIGPDTAVLSTRKHVKEHCAIFLDRARGDVVKERVI